MQWFFHQSKALFPLVLVTFLTVDVLLFYTRCNWQFILKKIFYFVLANSTNLGTRFYTLKLCRLKLEFYWKWKICVFFPFNKFKWIVLKLTLVFTGPSTEMANKPTTNPIERRSSKKKATSTAGDQTEKSPNNEWQITRKRKTSGSSSNPGTKNIIFLLLTTRTTKGCSDSFINQKRCFL